MGYWQTVKTRSDAAECNVASDKGFRCLKVALAIFL